MLGVSRGKPPELRFGHVESKWLSGSDGQRSGQGQRCTHVSHLGVLGNGGWEAGWGLRERLISGERRGLRAGSLTWHWRMV